ncbi:MAG: hypothetical protein ACI9F2_001042, partial [Lysobacterales bacterium]
MKIIIKITQQLICVSLSFLMVTTSVILPSKAHAQMLPPMPIPGSMMGLSGAYSPPLMLGIEIDPQNPFEMNFLMDQGQDPLSESTQQSEYTKLIKYFLSALTVSEDNLWVNLSPYEKDRIINDDFAQTQMGMDLLAQDYLLKQITSSLTFPENDTGAEFWETLRQNIEANGGDKEAITDVLNKVWIVPDEA